MEKRQLIDLKPNPRNHDIYGTEDVTDLLNRIKITGRIEDIKIIPDGTIISGHRRVLVAKLLGYTEIGCIVLDLDPLQQLELLLDENCYREKSNVQKINEGKVYEEIEREKSKLRRSETGKRNLGLSEVETDTTTDSIFDVTGKTRDIVGEKIQMSGKTFEKGAKVIDRINEETDPITKDFLIEVTNKSIDSAYKLTDKSPEFIAAVMETQKSNGGSISSVIRDVEKVKFTESNESSTKRFQTIYAVPQWFAKKTDVIKHLSKITISNFGFDDSILFLWVIPSMVEDIFKVIRLWGYKYQTCDSWESKDILNRNPFTGEGIQQLFICTKGDFNQQLIESYLLLMRKNQVDPYLEPEKFIQMMESDYSTKQIVISSDKVPCDFWGL